MITHALFLRPRGWLCPQISPASPTFRPRFEFSEIAARGIWLAIKGGAVVGGLVGTCLGGIFGGLGGGIVGAITGFLASVLLAPVVALWLISPWSQRNSVRITALITGTGAGALTVVPFAAIVGPFAVIPGVFAAWGSYRLTVVSAARFIAVDDSPALPSA